MLHPDTALRFISPEIGYRRHQAHSEGPSRPSLPAGPNTAAGFSAILLRAGVWKNGAAWRD
jgi:hypothetical protein